VPPVGLNSAPRLPIPIPDDQRARGGPGPRKAVADGCGYRPHARRLGDGAPAAEAKGLEMVLRVGREVPRSALGDPMRCLRCCSTFVGNAVKFTDRCSVTVRATAEPAAEGRFRLRVVVADTGIGIDQAAQARIFQKFTQADASTTRRFGGTGLGLAIARELVELMEGTIELASQSGHGSRFSFSCVLGGVPSAQALLSGPLAERRALLVGLPPLTAGALVEQLAASGVKAESTTTLGSAVGLLRAAEQKGQRSPVLVKTSIGPVVQPSAPICSCGPRRAKIISKPRSPSCSASRDHRPTSPRRR
jgi:hypothetical protein